MRKWNQINLEPDLSEDWSYQEQEFKTDYTSTSYIRKCKLTPVSQPENLYVIFYEFNPEIQESHSFAVRGGWNVLPKDSFRKFKYNEFDLAMKYMLDIMKETSKHYSAIESEEALESYNKKLTALRNKVARSA